MQEIHNDSLLLLRLRDVIARTGLSRSTIYALMKRGDFPKPIRLSRRAVAWRAADVAQWIEGRPLGGKDEEVVR